jgi:phospho-N-acetylmuramoyl-pentapeptide-transferase
LQSVYSLSTVASPSLLWALLLTFGLATALFPFYIKWLKSNEIRQFVREEGPASHAGKARTPTTGGICFIVAIVVTFLVFSFALGGIDARAVLVLILALLCGAVGLVDDLAKIKNRANRGLSAGLRLKLEAAIGGLFGLVLLFFTAHSQSIWLPQALGLGLQWQLPSWLFICLSLFLVASTTNALNLHDGMDGLAGGTSALVLMTMAVILIGTNQIGLAQLALAAVGALMAFLLFNRYPAKIFMGDTGSLFLGGLMAGLTIAGGLVFWFVPLSLIYIAETLSVIMQVSYFKLTKPYSPPQPINRLSLIWLKLTKRLPGEGKRLFRMAPLHHHFESLLALKGVPEWQVVAAFWLVQLFICLAVLAAFFLS